MFMFSDKNLPSNKAFCLKNGVLLGICNLMHCIEAFANILLYIILNFIYVF